MRQSKLLELLRCFSPAQWRRFGDFVRSPYFNQRDDAIIFYNYLANFYPNLNPPDFERGKVPREIAPDEKALAYLMNRIYSLTERFLAVESMEKDALESNLLVLSELQKNGLNKHFQSLLDKTRKTLENGEFRDASFYRRSFDIAELDYLSNTGPFRHEFNPALPIMANHLDRYYIMTKLRLLCDMSSHEKYLSIKFDKFFEEALLNSIHDSDILQEPGIALYYYAWKITISEEIADFEIFIALLNEHSKLVSVQEQKALYTYALNFCTRRINKYNDIRFYQKYLEINAWLLTQNLLFEDEQLPPWYFMNMVNAGVKTRQWDWTKSFIANWQKKLPPDYSENLTGYCMSLWYYAQGNFNDAQKALARIDFQDILLSLAARSLLIKIYFESDETELLFSALEANRIYLLRADKIEPGLRRQMQNFIDFTRRLAKIFPPDAAKYQKLLDALPPAAELMHREWLTEQIRKRL